LAKTDNDAMLPPAWLRLSLEVLERHPELTLLGIEAMYPHEDDMHLARSYTPAQFISGLGLYRRKAFLQSRPVPYQMWFGLEEWQMVQGAGLVRGWITPAIPVFLLDRIPFEPWKSYTDTYVRRGWQRSWPKYETTCTLWLWRWPGQVCSPSDSTSSSFQEQGHLDSKGDKSIPAERFLSGGEEASYRVVILSARASNLIACVQSILENEPTLPPEYIIVVDDGARANSERQLPGIRWLSGIKPFVYARNANLGIRQVATDVILLNDDARLLTPHGFTRMSRQVLKRPNIGICSAGIKGAVGNQSQIATRRGEFRTEMRPLAFICVYIRKKVFDTVGLLDERFVGYGFEDNDYCARVLAARFQLGIWHGCVVDHSGDIPSTFRTRPDLWQLYERNRRLFREKWGRDR
jgi:GT2 family glycosyltransferase